MITVDNSSDASTDDFGSREAGRCLSRYEQDRSVDVASAIRARQRYAAVVLLAQVNYCHMDRPLIDYIDFVCIY
jgi:hypothetical protein